MMTSIRKLNVFLVALIAILAALILLEVWINFSNPSIYRLDPDLGWRTRSDFSHRYQKRNFDNSVYEVEFTTNSEGLREFGKKEENAFTMLVIGDSYTMEPYASNSQMWWAVGAKELQQSNQMENPIHVLAGGAGGYGTLQELLLLRKILRIIKPNAVVLQVCDNDFSGNYYDFEKISGIRSQIYRRPYLQKDGSIKFEGNPFAAIWRIPYIGDSRIFNYIDTAIQIIQSKDKKSPMNESSIHKNISEQELSSYQVTLRLLKQFRNEIGPIPSFIVNCSYDDPVLVEQWRQLATQSNFIYLDLPAREIKKIRAYGGAVIGSHISYKDGSHLNVLGNEVFGKAFAQDIGPYIQNKSLHH